MAILTRPSESLLVCLSGPRSIVVRSFYGLPPLAADDEAVVSSAISILREFRNRRRWSYLKSVHPPPDFSPTQLAHILLRLRNHPRLALRLFLLSSPAGRPHHHHLTFAAAAHVLARHRLRSQALDVLNSAIRSLDPSSFSNSAATAAGEDDRPPKIFRALANTYRDFGSAPFVFDLLIRAYLRVKRLDRAVQIVRALRSRGISPQVGTANALIRSLSRTKGSAAGFDVYAEIFTPEDADGVMVRVSPNLGTFNTLLLALHREGNLEKMKEVREKMANCSCDPNVFTYSILMAALCEEGMVEAARELLGEMVASGIKPDVMAYNTMISGYSELGEMELAEELHRDMLLGGIDQTATTFEALISGYCKVGNVDSGLLLYQDMSRRGLGMEVNVVNEVLEELSKKDMVAQGLKILRDQMRREEFMPSWRSYEVLIIGFCENGNVEEATKLQAEMAGKGFGSSSSVYLAFIKAYENRGDVEKVEKLQHEMTEMSMNEKM